MASSMMIVVTLVAAFTVAHAAGSTFVEPTVLPNDVPTIVVTPTQFGGPYETYTDAIAANGTFASFYAFIMAVPGFADELNAVANATIFAPTNAGWTSCLTKILTSAGQLIQNNQTMLTEILKFHVMDGNTTGADLVGSGIYNESSVNAFYPNEIYPTWQGENMIFSRAADNLTYFAKSAGNTTKGAIAFGEERFFKGPNNAGVMNVLNSCVIPGSLQYLFPNGAATMFVAPAALLFAALLALFL